METTRPRRRARTWLISVSAALVALVGIAYLAAVFLHVPPPHTLVRFLQTAPSAQGTVFPSRPVTNSGPVIPLGTDNSIAVPATVPWKGDQLTVPELLEATSTRAFVVLHDGWIVDEWYAEDVDAGTPMSSWSVAKSVVSLLVGQAIGRGELTEDTKLVDVLPEMRTGGAYNEVTVGELLDMASGIDVPENYNEWWPFTGTARLLLSTDLPSYLKDHREIAFTPGSKAEYRSVDTQMLGMVVARLGGRPLAQILSDDLWTPLGAESDATWNLDTDGGIEKAFCCLNATARDFVRIGQLVVDDGKVGESQVVPQAWIDRISIPSGMSLDGWDYSAQWWHPRLGSDFTAIGVYGQYIYVDPDTETVIVKLSDYGMEQDEAETVRAMHYIARHLQPAG